MEAIWEAISKAATTTLSLMSSSAPYMVFGFSLGGLMHEFVPTEWLTKYLGRKGFLPIVFASSFGAFVPSWTCAILPVGVQIRQKGGGLGPVFAYFLAAHVNPSHFAIIAGILGAELAFGYAGAMLVGGIVIGVVTNLVIRTYVPKEESMSLAEAYKAQLAAKSQNTESTVDLVDFDDLQKPSLIKRVLGGLKYGLIDLAASVSIIMVLGFFLAGLISTLVPGSILTQVVGEDGFGPLTLAAGVTPFIYTSSYAMLPIAARLVSLGLAPGIAIVMLVFGAAANIPSFMLILRFFGRKAAVLYPVTIGIYAILAGFFINVVTSSGLLFQNVSDQVVVNSGSCWDTATTLSQVGSGELLANGITWNVINGVGHTVMTFFFFFLALYALYLEAQKHLFPRISRLLNTGREPEAGASSGFGSHWCSRPPYS